MGKFIGNAGAMVLGVLILALLVSIMIFIPAIILNYILLSMGIAVSFWVSVGIVSFIFLIALGIKNIWRLD